MQLSIKCILHRTILGKIISIINGTKINPTVTTNLWLVLFLPVDVGNTRICENPSTIQMYIRKVHRGINKHPV